MLLKVTYNDSMLHTVTMQREGGIVKRKLQQVRQKKNLSQAQVAQVLGVSRAAYNLIENGNRYPSYQVLVKLEDLFGMTHRELFAEAQNDPE